MAHPTEYRRPAEDAYGDSDDEVVTRDELLDDVDPGATSPLDLLIAAEEREADLRRALAARRPGP